MYWNNSIFGSIMIKVDEFFGFLVDGMNWNKIHTHKKIESDAKYNEISMIKGACLSITMVWLAHIPIHLLKYSEQILTEYLD